MQAATLQSVSAPGQELALRKRLVRAKWPYEAGATCTLLPQVPLSDESRCPKSCMFRIVGVLSFLGDGPGRPNSCMRCSRKKASGVDHKVVFQPDVRAVS